MKEVDFINRNGCMDLTVVDRINVDSGMQEIPVAGTIAHLKVPVFVHAAEGHGKW